MEKKSAANSNIWMNIVSWLQRNQVAIILALILAVGGFARTYQLEHFLRFYIDEVDHATIVKDFVTQGKLIAKGPMAVNRDGLQGYLGPAYYYLIVPAYIVTGFLPMGPTVFVVLVNLFTIWFLYWFGKTLFNKRVGIFAAFLLAISFSATFYSRWPWNPNILLPFVIGAMYGFYQMTNGKKHYLWLVTVCVAIASQLHSTGFLLLPIIGVLWLIYRPRITWQEALKAAGLFCLLYSPLIAYDITHHFSNSYAFIHTFTAKSSASNYIEIGVWDGFVRIFQFALKDLSGLLTVHEENNYLGIAVLFAAFSFLISKLSFNRANLQKYKGELFLFVWIVVFLLFSSFFHFDIWDYYFMVIWPAVLLMIGCFFDALWQKQWLAKVFVLAILVAIFSYNFDYARWAINNYGVVTPKNYGLNEQITYGDMQAVVQTIVADTHGKDFELKISTTHGLSTDTFKGSYLYLLGIFNHGHMPSETNSPTAKTIYAILQPYFETPEDLSKFGTIEWTKRIGNLSLVKISKY